MMKKTIFLFLISVSIGLNSCKDNFVEAQEFEPITLNEIIATWDIVNINFKICYNNIGLNNFGCNDNIVTAEEGTIFEITENKIITNYYGTLPDVSTFNITSFEYPIITTLSEDDIEWKFEINAHAENSLTISSLIPESLIADPETIHSMTDIFQLKK